MKTMVVKKEKPKHISGLFTGDHTIGFTAERALEQKHTSYPYITSGKESGGVLVPQWSKCGPCVSLPCIEFMGYRICAPSGIDRWRPCVSIGWSGVRTNVKPC
jgi:hypothetical protein